jgi:hypothetical protein
VQRGEEWSAEEHEAHADDTWASQSGGHAMMVRLEPSPAQYIALVQPHIRSSVLAAGVLSTVNSLRDTLLGRRSPGVESNRRVVPMATGAVRVVPVLPATMIVGLTASHLHCFSYRMQGRELHPQDEVACFARCGMQAQFKSSGMTDRLDLLIGEYRIVPFESMRGIEVNRDLFRHLLGVYGS